MFWLCQNTAIPEAAAELLIRCSSMSQGGGELATPPPTNKGKEETMVAHKVTSRVVASDCMPTTAGTLGVSAVVFLGGGA